MICPRFIYQETDTHYSGYMIWGQVSAGRLYFVTSIRFDRRPRAVDTGYSLCRFLLPAASIPYIDDAGRILDFHALRDQFISGLACAGVHPKAAEQLARHSTITLTIDRYSHTVIGDLAAALDRLPSAKVNGPGEVRKAVANPDIPNPILVQLLCQVLSKRVHQGHGGSEIAKQLTGAEGPEVLKR